MTQSAKKFVGEFEALLEADREQVLAELHRRAAAGPHDLPNDKDMVAAADGVLWALDWREQKR